MQYHQTAINARKLPFKCFRTSLDKNGVLKFDYCGNIGEVYNVLML